MRILLISRCPPWPLFLGDRLIVYHLAEELEARQHEIDLLAYYDRPDDPAEQAHYDHRFASVQLFPEPRRSPLSYLQRLLLPAARWPRRAQQSWSPPMWQAVEKQLASQDYDAIHLFGGIQVYELLHALGGRRAIITPYESYSLYLRRAVEAGNLTPRPPLRVQRGGVKAYVNDLWIGSRKGAVGNLVSWQSIRHLLPLPCTRGKGLGERGSGFANTIMNRIQLHIARRFEAFMFTPYARTVVVSERDRDELLSLTPSLKVDVIPNGVDTYYFRPRPVKRIPTLLFVGNYEYAPNVDAALLLATEIFPAVKAQIPEVRLWLVGHAPPPELLALQESSGLKPIVRVTGRVPDVRPYLARAGVFVSPLRLGAGIKNKVLEALALGCPVVATPLSLDGIGARDGEEALIADGAGMTDSIVRVLQDEGLRTRLSLNGRKLIEARYSWDVVAEQYERLYWSMPWQ